MSVNFNGNHLNSSSTNPFLNGACFEDENSFIRAISKINLTTLSQTDINTVIKIQTSLEKLKLRFPDKSDLIQTSIDNSISSATCHIFNLVPDIQVSLEGVHLENEKSCLLKVMLGQIGDMGDFTTEITPMIDVNIYSLKELCSNIHALSIKQLPMAVKIAEKLIAALKDENNVPDLVNFCANDPSMVQSLFSIVAYLGLDNFQNKHLEPFNKVFPNTPLNQAPETIKFLHLYEKNVERVNFSRFGFLKNLTLYDSIGMTAEQFNSIPNKASVESLNLSHMNITDFDFSGFTNLKKINLSNSVGMTAAQFNAIPNKISIKDFDLFRIDVTDFDFSEFEQVKLSDVENLSGAIFNKEIIRELHLEDIDVTDFDFSGLTGLRSLNLSVLQNLTVNQFSAIPNKSSIEEFISNEAIDGDHIPFDFSEFTGLTSLNLAYSYSLRLEQFSAIPNKNKIKHLNLEEVNVNNFDFSEFTSLESLNLSYTGDLSSQQFNSIPNKASIKTLTISNELIEDFDFSQFFGLKELILDGSEISVEQFNAIPNKASIETLNLSGSNLTDFDFSGFTNLKNLTLRNITGLTTAQLNTVPNKSSIEDLSLTSMDETDFDFSGFTNITP
jgi:hypothetical protein